MKKRINAGYNFQNEVVLENKYGDEVAVLELDPKTGYFHIPEQSRLLLDVGDVLKVVEHEVEIN